MMWNWRKRNKARTLIRSWVPRHPLLNQFTDLRWSRAGNGNSVFPLFWSSRLHFSRWLRFINYLGIRKIKSITREIIYSFPDETWKKNSIKNNIFNVWWRKQLKSQFVSFPRWLKTFRLFRFNFSGIWIFRSSSTAWEWCSAVRLKIEIPSRRWISKEAHVTRRLIVTLVAGEVVPWIAFCHQKLSRWVAFENRFSPILPRPIMTAPVWKILFISRCQAIFYAITRNNFYTAVVQWRTTRLQHRPVRPKIRMTSSNVATESNDVGMNDVDKFRILSVKRVQVRR